MRLRAQLDDVLTEALRRSDRTVRQEQLRRLVAVVDGAMVDRARRVRPRPAGTGPGDAARRRSTSSRPPSYRPDHVPARTHRAVRLRPREPHPERPCQPLRQPRTRRVCGRPSTRSCSSVSCGWRCCVPRPSSGIDVPADALADYERVLEQVDLDSIADRERVTRHDVKARIEEFNALAGHEQVHKGLTSRDLTENVEQLQILRSLEHVHAHGVAVAARLAERAAEYAVLVMAGRSHNVAAQATTLGKRFASAADELLVALDPAARADRPLPAARHQGPDGHRAGHARPPRRRRGEAGGARAEGRRAPRLRPRAHQRRPGVPALARPRRAVRAGAGGGRAVVVRAHHPPDGRPRAGHRGLPARPGRHRRRCRTR